ncbi:MAG: YbjQ family protein [Candidatus Bathyarchaeia archaeon]
MGSEKEFIVVTTPQIPGYRIKKVLGVVTGLTPRTRGVGGRFIAGVQTITGGEVSAYTSELEKARDAAMERVVKKARRLGANAIIGLDLETSDVFRGVVVISATGTAVVVEPEK